MISIAHTATMIQGLPLHFPVKGIQEGEHRRNQPRQSQQMNSVIALGGRFGPKVIAEFGYKLVSCATL